MSAQANIVGQVSKYCEDDSVFLTDERQANLRQMYTQNVLIIDTDTVFMYNHRNQNYAPIYDLNHLLNHADIAQLKKVIAKAI